MEFGLFTLEEYDYQCDVDFVNGGVFVSSIETEWKQELRHAVEDAAVDAAMCKEPWHEREYVAAYLKGEYDYGQYPVYIASYDPDIGAYVIPEDFVNGPYVIGRAMRVG